MVSIFVEGPTDKQLLEALLLDLIQQGACRIVSSGGRDAARPLARKELLVAHRPVALVIDADTTDAGRIKQQQRDLEDYLLWGAQGLPFRVLQFVPEAEVVFFQHPAVLRRILGDRLGEDTIVAGRFAPNAVLNQLLAPTHAGLALLVESLRDEDLLELRRNETVAELRSFVENSGFRASPLATRSA